MLFVMTSGYLNIDLTQKSFFYKSCGAFNELSNAVCRLSLGFVFLDLKGSRKGSPARCRDFQSPPGIGLNRKVCASCERGYAQYLHRIETGPRAFLPGPLFLAIFLTSPFKQGQRNT